MCVKKAGIMKSPDFWSTSLQFLKNLGESTAITGALLAFVMSFLQSLKSGAGKSCLQRIAEALTCSCLSMVTIPLAENLSLKIPYLQDMSFIGAFVGVFIGYIGSETIKGWIVRRVEKKVNSNE